MEELQVVLFDGVLKIRIPKTGIFEKCYVASNFLDVPDSKDGVFPLEHDMSLPIRLVFDRRGTNYRYDLFFCYAPKNFSVHFMLLEYSEQLSAIYPTNHRVSPFVDNRTSDANLMAMLFLESADFIKRTLTRIVR